MNRPECPCSHPAKPRVSIGLPVFNGERYLSAAIDSVLAQTFEDFELIISDNASTDSTQDTCLAYAARDPRVQYIRHAHNRGASFNFNFVFGRANGEFFKWLAHDDCLAADNLDACVKALDANPAAVLAYTHHIDIDENDVQLAMVSRSTGQELDISARFWSVMETRYTCEEVFGLIRSSILRRTPLIADHTDSDRTLLGELALYGRFAEVPAPLLFHRIHAESSCRKNPVWRHRALWFNPRLRGRLVLSPWRQFSQMSRAILTAPIGIGGRCVCGWQAMRWFKWRWRWMFSEVFLELRDYVKR